MNYTSISRLVMTPVLASLLLLVLLNASSIFKSFTLINNIETLESTLIRSERDVNEVLSRFKTQVQEWKNVLLRGHDADDRKKYWDRFQQREKAIQEKFQQMLSRSEVSQTVKADIQQFLNAHKLMARKYRQGYEAYMASNFDPKVGDDFVRGIDREPAKLLANIADEIGRQASDATRDLQRSTRSTLWLILVAAVLLSCVSVFYVIFRLRSQVIRPTKAIATCIRYLEKSNYTYPLTYRSNHELGALADSARTLQQKLQSSVSELQKAEQEMVNAITTLNSVNSSIMSGAVEQRHASQSLDASTDKLREIVHNLVTITDQVAVATNNSEENVASCYATFEQANLGFRQLATTVTASSEIVSELQSRSANILKVVNVINEIADQTNLLALNAAIEAARAGEHGRGFAVVADEVRALAAKTQQSTKQINDILSSFEAEAREAVTAMQEGKKLSDANAAEAASALETLNQVVRDIKETARVVVALNAAADEQEAVLGNVELITRQVVNSSEKFHTLSQGDNVTRSMHKMSDNVAQVVRGLSS